MTRPAWSRRCWGFAILSSRNGGQQFLARYGWFHCFEFTAMFSYPWQGDGNLVIFETPSSPSHPVILWLVLFLWVAHRNVKAVWKVGMLSGTLVLQKHKEFVFWLNLQCEQKVIFVKIFSSKKKKKPKKQIGCFLAQCVIVVQWIIKCSGALLCRPGVWSGCNLLSQEPHSIWKGCNPTCRSLSPPVLDAFQGL